MELMNQPLTGQLGNRLIELLDSPDYHTLNIAVAFAKNSGVLRIKDSLERFRQRGGIVNVYVGVDLGGSSYEALTALLLHTDSLSVVHSEKVQTFHPKIYQFIGEDKGLIVVGSHNLTGGGLWTNFESSVHISLAGASDDEISILERLNDYFKELSSLEDSFMSIAGQEDLDKLLEHGYISKEVSEQVRSAKSASPNETMGRLFGNGARARLPRVIMPKVEQTLMPVLPTTPTTAPTNDESETIWFETRSMTGGSRNILDLSKRSLIEHGDPTGTRYDLGEPDFMRGVVQFFGLAPSATDQTKDITLNFEGVDYSNNTILYPEGDSANGTWRLQIKGTSISGNRITDAFRNKGAEYLVNKIVTFTKVQDDYYFISVFPYSELDNFRAASRIIARNGATKTARQLGLL